MPGLLIRKTIVWHAMRAALAMIGAMATVVMIIGIGFLTFAIYVMTSAQHLLSIPGMAILACAIVLMARDELTTSFDDFVWAGLQSSTLQKCISGSFKTESGWLVLAQPKQPLAGIPRLVRFLGGRKRPIRVLRVVGDDGDEIYIGWDFRTMPAQSDGQVKLPDGTCYVYEKNSCFTQIR